ncbi:unnamed protein product [Ectocarpus sp. CCAP 1310/34]|nr:unnamed protein product [Ectocarpus sp. CCAP 1310/34]
MREQARNGLGRTATRAYSTSDSIML